jgi:menaquinone-dependent protoporphyrinogen IX oxidase
MSALVVHGTKDGEESTRTLYTSRIIAVAKARGLFQAGWRVHIVDADGRVFHLENFDQVLRFAPKPATK